MVHLNIIHSKTMSSCLTRPKYRPDIDGLRAIAVLSVVGFHAFPGNLKGGFIGVDIFFVISGFLISTIIFEDLNHERFSFSEFYGRRIRRIFPSLILVLCVCLVFGWFSLLADEFNQLGKHMAAGASFVSNLVFWNEAGYFDNSAETKPLLHLWSLGIEEQFYIFWPLVLWCSRKRKFNVIAITALVTVSSFVLNLKGIKQDVTGTFFSPLTRFWELLCGGFLACFNRTKKGSVDNKFLANILSSVGLLMLIWGFWKMDKDLSFPGNWALLPVLAAGLIITAGENAWTNRTVLSNKFVVWFGLISFPLYLWHWPIFSFGRIITDEMLSKEGKLLAVFISILLSWITVEWVEKPFRFGKNRIRLKTSLLIGLVFVIGMIGLVVNNADFSESRTYKKIALKRKGFEHAFGYSLAWYRGKEDWLFLGNAYDNGVSKLKLSIVPTEDEIKATTNLFSKISQIGAKYDAKVVLIVGADKSGVYPEYLPEELVPSNKRYASFFLDSLKDIPNLSIYYPTADLRRHKKKEGILYGKTDTHWNSKGAFFAYSGFSKLLGLPVPQVDFKPGNAVKGDLISISKLKNFPLHSDDNWNIIWKNKPVWIEKKVPAETSENSFGIASIVTNQNPMSTKSIWVFGDSFTEGLRPYFNVTFKEVRYMGHWAYKLNDLPKELAKADTKPDYIFVVRVEQSF